ncbi:MAG: hypothetical protein EP329_20610 [Deltaproteobacteria bacterium]|nr:MAG: hypothetical protein EP329_20610 [Deltaproteobacteria bacterium]
MKRTFATVLLLALPSGCGGDAARLPIGASCQAASECSSGLCGSSVCLDPAADDDGDTLVNAVEVALGTAALLADTDGDGLDDPTEVVDVAAPADTDGDGHIDAIESLTADYDSDCLPDQLDDQDFISNYPEDREGACGDGTYLGIGVCGLLVKPLRDTCAAPLADGFACFDPVGQCQLTVDDEGATYTWQNGAYHHGGLFSSSGEACVLFAGAGLVAGKQEFAYSAAGGGASSVTCPDGTEVPLERSLEYAIYYCVQGGSGCSQAPLPDDASSTPAP